MKTLYLDFFQMSLVLKSIIDPKNLGFCEWFHPVKVPLAMSASWYAGSWGPMWCQHEATGGMMVPWRLKREDAEFEPRNLWFQLFHTSYF